MTFYLLCTLAILVIYTGIIVTNTGFSLKMISKSNSKCILNIYYSKKSFRVNLFQSCSFNTLTMHSARPPVLDMQSWMEWEEKGGILDAQFERKQAEERSVRESDEQRKGERGREREGSLAVICCCSAASRCAPQTDL